MRGPGTACTARAPILDWIRALPRPVRLTLGLDLQRLEYRWPVGMPHARPLGGGLHEMRSNLSGGRIARIVFFVAGSRLIIVHGFIKKTRATPRADLALARARQQAWEQSDG